MIKRLMMLFVMIACVMMMLLLFIKQEEQFHVLYHEASYSIMKSSTAETFQIEMFASSDESFYLDVSYIVRANIKNTETSELVAVNIERIDVSKEEVLFDNQSYHYVSLQCSLSLTMESYETTYEDAVFELYYENNEVLMLDLGEFFYIEQTSLKTINILEMIATHEEYHGLTVSGLYLELGHKNTKDITIKNIFLGSSEAEINPFYTKEMFSAIQYDDLLEDILYPSNFHYLNKNSGYLDYRIRPHQTRAFYFPLTYLKETYVLHRFYIKIEYIIDGVLKQEVIDDFPFIRQTIFEVKEEDFDVYYPRMYGE